MKPTKKQLKQNVNNIIRKDYDENLEDIEIIEMLNEFKDPAKVLALGKFLGLTLEETKELNETNYDIIEHGSYEYLVLDDNEADQKWEESIENYIDECILPELPEFAKKYFDNEAFKRDASFDGRGHSLASYDGVENEQISNNETYYIYRVN